jgi:hypothetical protein
MMTRNNAVVAIYKSHTEVEAAVKELQRSGFDMTSAGGVPVMSEKLIKKELAITQN